MNPALGSAGKQDWGFFPVVTRCGLAILRFSHAEPVPEWVLENRFYSVKLLLRAGQELYTLGLKLFNRLAAVGGLEGRQH